MPTDPDTAEPSSNAGMARSKTGVPILVNIGDLLSYWTNGLLKSTVHRVVFPKRYVAADMYPRTCKD